MITVSDAFKQAWLNGNQKFILLSFSDGTTIDDDGIVLESFSLEQALCTEDQLCFGLTSSACCKVQIFNTGKQYKGLTMTVSMAAVDEEEQYYIQNLGTYKVDSDVRSDDRAYRTLTAYDALYDVLNTNYAEWYNSYFDSHGTPSMAHFRNAFFEHIGIEQETATLEQDSLVLRKKSGVTSLSGADIILGICETSATFGFLNYDGRFQYSKISDRGRSFPADDLYPSNSLYPSEGADMVLDGNTVEGAPILGGLVYSDYFTHKITGARFEYTENTPEVSAGTSNNVYQFRDSVLMYGQTTSSLQGICSSFVEMVKGFFYNPTKVTARARVWAQVGDLVRATSENDSVLFPIMKRSMSGITALYDTYEAQGTEYYTYSVNSYDARLTSNKTAIAEVSEDVSEVSDTVENINDEIYNEDDGILTQLQAKIEVDEVVSAINASADTISLTAGRLLITSGNFQLDSSGNATATSFKANDFFIVRGTRGQTENFYITSKKATLYNYLAIGTGDGLEDARVNLGRLTAEYIFVTTGLKVVGNDFTFNNKTVATTDQLSNYVTVTQLGNQSIANIDVSNRVSVNGYLVATENYVNSRGFLTSHQSLSGYVNSVEQETWSNTWSTWSNHTIVKSATKSGKTITVTNVNVNVSSDKRLKEDILPLEDFTAVYMRLEPIRYIYHDDLGFEDRGIHFGFIAQDFKRICDEEGVDLSNNEYAIWHTREADALGHEDKYVKDDALQEFILDEFHALHIQMIQKQQRQIEEQGREIDALKSEVAELKAMLKEVLNVGKQK